MEGIVDRAIGRCLTLRPAAADLLLAALVLISSLGMLFVPGDRPAGQVPAQAVVITVVGTLPLVARRRWPFAVLAVAALAETLYLATGTLTRAPIGLGMAVALYTVATRSDRRTSLRIAILVAAINAAVLLVGGLAFGRPSSVPILFAVTAITLGSWSLGENARTRRAYLAGLEERARRLELEREEDARRAVQEERSRIARELHDVVAHHVSAIAVQAGAAEAIAERNPARARETLRIIQETSRQALSEMRAMLNVLRSDDEVGSAREPQPSLASVERLVGQSRVAGLSVTLRVEGAVHPLPEALDLSAYRIVQEALTNSLKHAGPAHASVRVRYAAESLELEISDDGVGQAAANGTQEGRGLIGMRERVALFGGELAAGPAAGGGFRVWARLPMWRT